jgi:membrane fusion protein, multidrug efflux system
VWKLYHGTNIATEGDSDANVASRWIARRQFAHPNRLMEKNGSKHGTETGPASAQFAADLNGTLRRGGPAAEGQKDIQEEIRELRLEVDRLRALQPTAQADNISFDDQMEGEREDNPPTRDPAHRTLPYRRPLRLILLVALVAFLCVSGFKLWKYLQSYENTDDAEIDGYLDPISSRINGTVSAVYVDNNQRVRAGQLLVVLDPHDYQVAVDQARAQLAQAQADVNSARQQYVSAVATVRQAQAQNYLAQRNAERHAVLFRLQVVPAADFDQYQATARVAAATVKVDEAAAASAQRTIASHEAQVQEAEAALEQAELNLTYTRIKAPADGIIGNRSAELGQRVQPGQSLMALTQRNELWVTANFKETQLAHMHREQPVTIYVDALGHDFKGQVQGMPGATGSLYELLPPENATGNYVKIVQRLPVRIAFDQGQDLSHLRPGMSVEPKVWLR